MMPSGLPGKIYRAAFGRNDNGDPIDADGNVTHVEENLGCFIGDLVGILPGGPSASPTLGRGTESDTTGQIGIPIKGNPVVKFNDILLIDSVRYKVVSRAKWAFANSMTTTQPMYMWFNVDAPIDG